MDRARPTRREFLRSSAGALGSSWLWLNLPALGSLAACAREAAVQNEAFRTFTDVEARAMRAFAARIVPSDEALPGAEEAGAVYFADRALVDLVPELLPPVREGLADLDTRAVAAGAASFADLDSDAQDTILREIEETPFFGGARALVVFGVFSNPEHGGNRNGVGAQILGYTHESGYQPPFGYYDAEANGAAAGGAA